MKSSKYTIREQNEAVILKTILDEQPVSRANLSSLTGLNKASVSSIIKKLLDDELVIETGIGSASTIGGRKPIMLCFNAKSALAISIDIGSNYIKALLSYLDGTEVTHVFETRLEITKDNVLNTLVSTIEDLEKKQPVTKHGIVGITIAIHGIVFDNNIIFTPYYNIDELDLVRLLSMKFDYPIIIENEANLAAIGEYTFSSNYDSLIGISIHSGIGAGIVEDGCVQQGKRGKAGEIGHSILFPGGLSCPCGNNGCLEQYASNQKIFDKISLVKNEEFVNSKTIAKYYYDNDLEVVEHLNKVALYLSIGINNIITTYDPEVVVINSSLTHEIPELIELIKQNMVSHFSNKVLITHSTLGTKSTLLGALAVTSQNFLNIQKLRMTKLTI